jgi:hypothetical protein
MKYDGYKIICECFLNLAKDEQTKKLLENVLFTGVVGDCCFSTEMVNKDNPAIERIRRIAMANLLINSPETFEFFVSNNINIFHGTNANALPGILKYGLNSVNESVKKGQPVLTGEEWTRISGKRSFVSFSDIFEIALYYSSSTKGSSELSFNVIICTSSDEMEKARRQPVYSDIPEIGVENNFPLESIKCICVPDDKVEFVRKMVNNDNIRVLGIKPNRRFYHIYDWVIEVLPDKYKEYEDNLMETKSARFSTEEVAKIAKGRSLINMGEFIRKFKNLILKLGGENERKIR